ncbi:RNA-directed DNA polymerase, eukaryota, reverse transcriptase zinc-binding domain protein [Tanacetum coccineum]
MNNMTARRCQFGEGRMDFARVLVEFDVVRGFKEKIKVQYRDINNNKKGSKERSEEEIVMETKRKEELSRYFKDQWEIDRQKEAEEMNGNIEEVLEVNSGIAKELSTVEVAVGLAFGGWDWVSNSVHSTNSYRILIGWDKNKVDIMKEGIYGLRRTISITTDWPWILMGDFNVTLKVEEHSTGGLQFTWIKSHSKPETSIMKKLDRVMANSDFLDKYGGGLARFHPFLISDHSPIMMHIPNPLERKNKSFRFSNFIADNNEFIYVVKREWRCDCEGYNMYKLVKKMENMKIPLNKLAWKNGNLFQNVKKLEDELKKAQVKVEAVENVEGG